MSNRSDRSCNVPAIIRVAGLPADSIASMRCERLLETLDALDALDARLASLRQETSDRIFTVLTDADPEIRRHLLKLKRDCFNGRSLRKHRRAAHWPSLQRWLGDLGDRMAAVEDEIAAVQEQLRAQYFADRDRGRIHLRELTRQPELMRGVTLASPRLAQHLDRLHACEVDRYQRRERKVAHSFLRYVTRAAAKLSPYSTLTKLALGVVADGGEAAVRFLDDPRRERSLVRVKRYLLDQCCRLLFYHPAVRDRLVLCLNDTLEELGDAQHRFLRPAALVLDEDSGDLRHVQPSIVQVRLRGPLIAWLKESLDRPGTSYAEARSAVIEHFDAALETIEPTLSRLIEIGFLRLVPPWASHETHLEPRLLQFLSGIEGDTGLGPVIDTLAELVAIERSFATTADAAHAVGELDRLVSLLFERIRDATRPGSALRFQKAEHNYYEDLLVFADRSPAGEILRVDRATAEELLHASGLLFSLSYLYEPRHELHPALYHFIRDRWPERERVPFLELFATIQPLWEEFLAYLAAPRHGDDAFDPYGLEEIAELKRLRQEFHQELVALYAEDDEGVHLPLAALEALVARIPRRYRRLVSPCLFAQPADADGRAWVANRFFESTGRLSCRYTAVLDAEMRAHYIEHFERCGRFSLEGEEVELLDVLFTQGNTVNLHWPQTPKVLEIPGEHTDVPEARRRRLRDLLVAVDAEQRRCVVRDTHGQRYIPCFLSPLQQEYLPSVVKMLDVFGSMARSSLRLPRMPRGREGVTIYPRLRLGRLIILRKRWILAKDHIPTWDMAEDQAFLAIQRWRRAHGVPAQCFVIEPVTFDYVRRKVFKPQYIDFRIPELVALFRATLATAEEAVTIEEAVPTPDDFPLDQQGQRRGVEIILEGLTLQT